MNYSKKLREGWEPVPLAEAPEMEHLVLDPNPRFKGNVEVGGLLLCRMPDGWRLNAMSIISISLKRRCAPLTTHLCGNPTLVCPLAPLKGTQGYHLEKAPNFKLGG